MAAAGHPGPGGGGGRRGGPPSYPAITFEEKTLIPTTSDMNDLDVVAFVKAGNRPIETDLDMYIDGTFIETIRTGEDGRIRWNYQHVPAGGFRNNSKLQVTAQIPRTATRRSETINVPKTPEKAKLIATQLRLDPDQGHVDPANGQKKTYHINIFATTDDGKPVPGTKITCCYEGVTNTETTPSDTNDVLCITKEVDGYDKTSALKATLPNGTSVSLPLYGPRRPKPDPGALAAGSKFLEALRHGLKGGKK